MEKEYKIIAYFSDGNDYVAGYGSYYIMGLECDYLLEKKSFLFAIKTLKPVYYPFHSLVKLEIVENI